MNKETYSEKLRDPRWQKKRLEILTRDEWTCQNCADTQNTLHVHHRIYEKGNDPWDIANDCLITLCAVCHEQESNNINARLQELNIEIKKKFLSNDLIDLTAAFHFLQVPHLPEVFASAVLYWFKDPELTREMIQRYFDRKKTDDSNSKD